MSTEKEILEASQIVAVVGLSSNPERPSHIVSSYLRENGYRIIPVNPSEKSVLGETSYPDLASIPERVDVVTIFRRSEDVLPIVQGAIRIGANAVWMQEGVVNAEAAEIARKSGLKVVMDRCMSKEHKKLQGHSTSN